MTKKKSSKVVFLPVHMMINDHEYLCFPGRKGKNDKLTSDWNKVTCQNCLIIGGKVSLLRKKRAERRDTINEVCLNKEQVREAINKVVMVETPLEDYSVEKIRNRLFEELDLESDAS